MTTPRENSASRSIGLLALTAVVSTLWTTDVRAELKQPDCDALGTWAKQFDRNDEWQPQPEGVDNR